MSGVIFGSNRHERVLADAKSAARELRTLRDLLRWAVSHFEAAQLAYGHGTDNAWDEAVSLLLFALHLPPEQLDPWLDARLSQREREGAIALLARRIATRLPAPYLTGEAWLRGLRFVCDERALVPRSPIAEALDEALSQWLDVHRPNAPYAPCSVLDLCTGGGSLAVFAALAFPEASIVGADVSTHALDLAALNGALYELEERIEWVRSDLFEALASQRFDLIVCNPPYVNEASMRTLPAEFRAEPQGALAGGSDGMDLARRIVTQAGLHLEVDGLLLLEIGHEAVHFEAAFPELEFHYLPVAAGEQQIVLIEAAQLASAK